MVAMPIGYVWIGGLINRWLIIPCPRNIELVLAGISGVLSLLMIVWSIWTQWIVGRGGPVPIAPTQKLITSGPYVLCRNPMHLGSLLYVFAFGLIFGNLVIGLICIALEISLLTVYLKGVEEKELLLRFGEEYEHYKEKTPFLIPHFRKSQLN
jgi:protein-S-isoprenylcysteine O-methyltransferase Ste14